MDPDPGGTKTCGTCGSGSESPTLLVSHWQGKRHKHESMKKISSLVRPEIEQKKSPRLKGKVALF
jgi:hypothetical protein